MTDQTEATRAAFEAWAEPLGYQLMRGSAGSYLSTKMRCAWAAWQAATAAAQAGVPDGLPANGAYIIRFDDADRGDEFFAMSGARDAALARFEQISESWNASLFAKIKSNCRDVSAPDAMLAAAPSPPAAAPATPMDIVLDQGESETLRDCIGDISAQAVRLHICNGHSGYGLYVSSVEYPDEGATLVTALDGQTTEPEPIAPPPAAEVPAEDAAPELKYCWSTDGELYHDGFATTEEAIAQLEGRSGFIAEIVPVGLDGLVDADGLVETMICRAGDEGGEAAEDWLSFVKRADIAELHGAIMPAVAAWVEKHEPIYFWGVRNPINIAATDEVRADG